MISTVVCRESFFSYFSMWLWANRKTKLHVICNKEVKCSVNGCKTLTSILVQSRLPMSVAVSIFCLIAGFVFSEELDGVAIEVCSMWQCCSY